MICHTSLSGWPYFLLKKIANPKSSIKLHRKALANKKTPKGRKPPHGNSTKGLARKGSNGRKQAASDGSENNRTDGEPKQSSTQLWKKVRKQKDKDEKSDKTESEAKAEDDQGHNKGEEIY